MAWYRPRLLLCFAVLVALAAVALPLLPRLAKRRMRSALLAAQAQESKWSGNPLLSNVSGTPVAPFITSERIRELSNGTFQHRPSDVWVVTYPKCGTTWVQAIVASLSGWQIDGVTPQHFERYCPWPERAVGRISSTLARVHGMSAPRCLKSHWFMRDHMALKTRGKVIYVMRNALDVAVSSFHHYNDFLNVWDNSSTWDEFFDLFAAGDIMSGSYFAHVASWWRHRNDPDVLLLRYEDLKREPKRQIRRIGAFIGVQNLSDARVGEVMEATDFKRMRSLEETFWPRVRRLLGLRQSFRMRKGETGQGQTVLGVMERATLQQLYEQTLEPLRVPWDWVLEST